MNRRALISACSVYILKVRVFEKSGEDIDPAPALDQSLAPSFTAKQVNI